MTEAGRKTTGLDHALHLHVTKSQKKVAELPLAPSEAELAALRARLSLGLREGSLPVRKAHPPHSNSSGPAPLVPHRVTDPRSPHGRATWHRRRQRASAHAAPAINPLVETGVPLTESHLWRHHEDWLEQLRRAVAPLLTTCSGPMLLVDDNGWVAPYSGLVVRERIAAPRADRALAIPVLGLCLPQPLADGWLVRPSGADQSICAELNLADAPILLS
jgi:hypothetical protein